MSYITQTDTSLRSQVYLPDNHQINSINQALLYEKTQDAKPREDERSGNDLEDSFSVGDTSLGVAGDNGGGGDGGGAGGGGGGSSGGGGGSGGGEGGGGGGSSGEGGDDGVVSGSQVNRIILFLQC